MQTAQDREGVQIVTEHEEFHPAMGQGDANLVLEAMRHLADQQLDRAERLRNAARQTFLLVAGLFTITQAVAVNSIGAKGVTHFERDLIIVCAIAAIGAITYLGICAVQADELKKIRDIAPQDIIREAAAAPEDVYVSERLTKLYLDAAKRRIAAVEARRQWLTGVSQGAILAIGAVVIELAVTLLARA